MAEDALDLTGDRAEIRLVRPSDQPPPEQCHKNPRGRAGRQGDPGSSRFYLSLEDDLMRLFGSDRIAGIMERLGLKEGDVIKAMDSKAVANGRQLVELLKKKEHGDKVNFTVARNSENKEIALTSGSDEVDKRVTIEKKDIFTLDLSKAQVITLYLLPELNVKLIPQLEKLKPGCRIVSHDFDMRGVKPKKVERITAKDDNGNEREHTIYLWITPLEKEKE